MAWWHLFKGRSRTGRSRTQPAEGRIDWLVAGLGNPGERYAGTRHNFGFIAADALVRQFGGEWSMTDDRAMERCPVQLVDGTSLEVLRPQAFMNRSGPPVLRSMRRAGLNCSRLIVLADDLALPFGTIRIREGGGDGGHNGLRSLAEALGNGGFIRVRMGLAPAGGMPPAGEWVDFVLGRFMPEEEEDVHRVARRAVSAVLDILDRGPAAAMSRFNRRKRVD